MNSLTKYFQKRLNDLGFDTMDVEDFDIRYSLNYCQGDGVAFYGDIRHSLENLFQLFLKEVGTINQKINLRHNADKFFDLLGELYDDNYFSKIYGNSFSHHYSHSHTMELEGPEELDEYDIEILKRYASDYDLSFREVNLFIEVYPEFYSWLEEHIRYVSRVLEKEGYELYENCSVEDSQHIEKNTDKYRISISVEKAEFDDLDEFDVEEIKLGYQFAFIKAIVEDKLSETMLGESYSRLCCFKAGDKNFCGSLRDVVKEAISEARNTLTTQFSQQPA
ncbi:hypothetical protein IO43_00420 [Gallibacterium anatis 7990]|uniref:hypothetical protein n=1 Tax=Gallibacterium anatis TaxID=750 RepID=UPI000531112C|nr:hypothetical protein [Gallibacterium anatis]KGQ66090.1 hypothetical protein IO43_00420 [Gallibacterium anatis 7990]